MQHRRKTAALPRNSLTFPNAITPRRRMLLKLVTMSSVT